MARAVVINRRVAKIDTIEIDSCLDETHDLTNTVTDHPVEEGFNISDHNRPNADIVRMKCFVSNTPLSQEQRTRAIRQGDIDFQTTAAQAVQIGAVDGRGANTYNKLYKLRMEGTLIAIVTSLRTYGVSETEGMTINSISIPRTRENYDGLEFDITLKQIKIVRNRQTTDRQQKEKHTRKEKKEGQKTTAEPVDKRSALAKNYDEGGLSKKIIGAF